MEKGTQNLHGYSECARVYYDVRQKVARKIWLG